MPIIRQAPRAGEDSKGLRDILVGMQYAMSMETEKIQVLVIDDDEQVRDILRLWLEREGFTVQLAENGRIGIMHQREDPSEVVICDLIMPEQEGIETITQFNQEFPGVGIIAISGGGKISPQSYLAVAGTSRCLEGFQQTIADAGSRRGD